MRSKNHLPYYTTATSPKKSSFRFIELWRPHQGRVTNHMLHLHHWSSPKIDNLKLRFGFVEPTYKPKDHPIRFDPGLPIHYFFHDMKSASTSTDVGCQIPINLCFFKEKFYINNFKEVNSLPCKPIKRTFNDIGR